MAQIIIVDDSISVRTPLRVILENFGHEVFDFEDGKQAREFTRTKTVDLVITDLNMPIMNGMTLVASLRSSEEYKSIPILILTTEFSDRKKSKARSLGATGWLTKPFTEERIKKALEKTLH